MQTVEHRKRLKKELARQSKQPLDRLSSVSSWLTLTEVDVSVVSGFAEV